MCFIGKMDLVEGWRPLMGLTMFALMLATSQLLVYGIIIGFSIKDKNNMEPIEDSENKEEDSV